MRRRIVLFVSACLSASAMAGCISNVSEPTPTQSTPESSAPDARWTELSESVQRVDACQKPEAVTLRELGGSGDEYLLGYQDSIADYRLIDSLGVESAYSFLTTSDKDALIVAISPDTSRVMAFDHAIGSESSALIVRDIAEDHRVLYEVPEQGEAFQWPHDDWIVGETQPSYVTPLWAYSLSTGNMRSLAALDMFAGSYAYSPDLLSVVFADDIHRSVTQ